MNTQKTILVVEDEKDLREALRDALQRKNYLVHEAENGRVGLEAAIENHPDLILLDLLMPEMDGMTAFKHIREAAWGKDVPVIILTNLNASSEDLIEDIVTHKPAEYLIKSDWKIHDVVKKVDEILQKYRK